MDSPSCCKVSPASVRFRLLVEDVVGVSLDAGEYQQEALFEVPHASGEMGSRRT